MDVKYIRQQRIVVINEETEASKAVEAIIRDSIYAECETRRLYLRVLLPAAAPAAADYYRRNRRIIESREPEYPAEFFCEEFQEYLLKRSCDSFDAKKGLSLFIFTKEKPFFPMGHISLINIRRNAHLDAQLGYKIDEALWNRGYATEAVKRVVDIGFDEFGLERIEAFVAEDNPASARVLTANGFVIEGIRRHHVFLGGRWLDHGVYSILRPEVLI